LTCPKELFSVEEDFTTRQICVTETINLEAEQQKSEVLRRREIGESKEKIIEYAWWLKKDCKSDSTIKGRTKLLQILIKRGANLYDPKSVKDSIAKQPWGNGRKNNAVDAYSSFLRMLGQRGSTALRDCMQAALHPKNNRRVFCG
jgi:hypothetical protein